MNRKVDEDPDYIVAPKYNNSLRELLAAKPNGISDSFICSALEMSLDELGQTYRSALNKLRIALGEHRHVKPAKKTTGKPPSTQ